VELATGETTEEGVTTVAPSGLEIYYQSKPKRLYRVRKPVRLPESSGAGGDIHPQDESEWVEVPSVTTVLDVLAKDSLTWWGQGIGVAGVMELVTRNLLFVGEDENGFMHLIHRTGPTAGRIATQAEIIELLKLNHLTTNHVRDVAAVRGSTVHDALEAWSATGFISDPATFHAEQSGYVTGLNAWIADLDGAAESEGTEIMVASLEHRFAGRYDNRLRLNAPRRLVTKITASRKPRYTKYAVVPAGVGIVDLKTSKDVYNTHGMQCEAYEGASVECGYDPTDWRAVLNVTADGYYQFVQSRVTFDDFLAIRAAYDAVGRADKALTAAGREGK
jgi:hypothetical protein